MENDKVFCVLLMLISWQFYILWLFEEVRLVYSQSLSSNASQSALISLKWQFFLRTQQISDLIHKHSISFYFFHTLLLALTNSLLNLAQINFISFKNLLSIDFGDLRDRKYIIRIDGQ